MSKRPTGIAARADRLARLHADIYRQCAPRYAQDLGHQSVRALQLLGDGPATVATLAAGLHCAHNTASELATRLARRGLVRKERARHDERIVEVYMTAAGRSLLEEHTLPDRARLERGLQSISEDDGRAVLSAFEVLLSALKRAKP